MRDSKHIFLALNWLGWEIEKMKLFKPLRRRHRRRNWYVFYIKTIKISMFIFNVLTKSSYLINTGSYHSTAVCIIVVVVAYCSHVTSKGGWNLKSQIP